MTTTDDALPTRDAELEQEHETEARGALTRRMKNLMTPTATRVFGHAGSFHAAPFEPRWQITSTRPLAALVVEARPVFDYGKQEYQTRRRVTLRWGKTGIRPAAWGPWDLVFSIDKEGPGDARADDGLWAWVGLLGEMAEEFPEILKRWRLATGAVEDLTRDVYRRARFRSGVLEKHMICYAEPGVLQWRVNTTQQSSVRRTVEVRQERDLQDWTWRVKITEDGQTLAATETEETLAGAWGAALTRLRAGRNGGEE